MFISDFWEDFLESNFSINFLISSVLVSLNPVSLNQLPEIEKKNEIRIAIKRLIFVLSNEKHKASLPESHVRFQSQRTKPAVLFEWTNGQNIYTSFSLFYVSRLYKFLFFCCLVDNQVKKLSKNFRNGYFHIELSITQKQPLKVFHLKMCSQKFHKILF